MQRAALFARSHVRDRVRLAVHGQLVHRRAGRQDERDVLRMIRRQRRREASRRYIERLR